MRYTVGNVVKYKDGIYAVSKDGSITSTGEQKTKRIIELLSFIGGPTIVVSGLTHQTDNPCRDKHNHSTCGCGGIKVIEHCGLDKIMYLHKDITTYLQHVIYTHTQE